MDWVIAGIMIVSAVYGWYLQSKLAGGTKQPKPVISGPTASEGIAIPVVFGTRQATDINITWYGGLYDTNPDGPHYYYCWAQFGICHGKLDEVVDVIVNNKSCLAPPIEGGIPGVTDDSAQITVTTALGRHPDSSIDVGGKGTVNLGAVNNSGVEAGVADDLAGKMSLAAGPKYYGVATFWGLIDMGGTPAINPWEFLVRRIHTRKGGAEVQWYDATAEIKTGRGREDTWKYKVQANNDYSDWSGVAYDVSGWSEGPYSVGTGFANVTMYSSDKYPLPFIH